MSQSTNGNGSTALAKKEGPNAIEAIGGRVMDIDRSHEMAAVAVAAAAKAQVEARFVMAMHRPRSFDLARERVLKSCDRPGFADKAIYRKPQGGQTITGLSIRFAEEVLRAWGNVEITADVIYDDDERVIVKVTATDLETVCSESDSAVITKRVERKSRGGAAPQGREIIGSRLNSYNETTFIVRATDDEVMVKVAAVKSKLIRNVGLRLIPADILEEARAACEATTERETVQDLPGARAKMIGAFGKLQPAVLADELSKFLGHDVKQASVAEMAELRQVFAAVSQEGSRWSEALAAKLDSRAPVAPPTPAAPAAEAAKVPEVVPASAPVPAAEKVVQAAPSAPAQAAAPITSANPANEPSTGSDDFAVWLMAQMQRAATKKELALLSRRKGDCPEARHADVLACFNECGARLSK